MILLIIILHNIKPLNKYVFLYYIKLSRGNEEYLVNKPTIVLQVFNLPVIIIIYVSSHK